MVCNDQHSPASLANQCVRILSVSRQSYVQRFSSWRIAYGCIHGEVELIIYVLRQRQVRN